MKVINIEKYRDGGTIEISTDEGDFCVDMRINTPTPKAIYNGYPNNKGSRLANESEKDELIDALANYSYLLIYNHKV